MLHMVASVGESRRTQGRTACVLHDEGEAHMQKLLTPAETAARLRVTIATLERWRCGRSGPHLPYLRLGEHGSVRYREADVQAVIDDNLRGAASEATA